LVARGFLLKLGPVLVAVAVTFVEFRPSQQEPHLATWRPLEHSPQFVSDFRGDTAGRVTTSTASTCTAMAIASRTPCSGGASARTTSVTPGRSLRTCCRVWISADRDRRERHAFPRRKGSARGEERSASMTIVRDALSSRVGSGSRPSNGSASVFRPGREARPGRAGPPGLCSQRQQVVQNFWAPITPADLRRR
jgi:hypothetical protein